MSISEVYEIIEKHTLNRFNDGKQIKINSKEIAKLGRLNIVSISKSLNRLRRTTYIKFEIIRKSNGLTGHWEYRYWVDKSNVEDEK